jgi:hypothetical protein
VPDQRWLAGRPITEHLKNEGYHGTHCEKYLPWCRFSFMKPHALAVRNIRQTKPKIYSPEKINLIEFIKFIAQPVK